MKVTQEKLPASQLGLEIEITPEMSKQAYEKTIRDFSRNINISGFRRGKVPRHVLIQRIGAGRIKMAVLEDLIESGVQEAIKQEQIEAIGNAQLRSSFDDLVRQFEPGSPLTFSAAVDVPPEVELTQYTGLHVKAEEIAYDPSKVDEILEDYRNRTATLVPVEDRAAQMGDVVLVDFSGKYTPAEGEEAIDVPGGSAQDFQLELKEGQFIGGFVEGVVGMKPDETREVSVTFPDDYSQEEVAGKPAVFTITAKEIKEKELPDLDDDFAQEISEFETLQELRDTLEKRFQNEAEQQTTQNKTSAIVDELVKHIDVELPETLIKREVDLMVTQTVIRLENQGLNLRKMLSQELVEGMRERSRPEAIARLKRTLALGEVAKRESIQVEKDELDEKVKEFMKSYQDQDVDPNRVRQVLEDELIEKKVIDWLEENWTVELVPEGTLESDTETAEDTAATVEPDTLESETDTTETHKTEADKADTAETVDVEAVDVEAVEAVDVEAVAAEDAIAPEKTESESKSKSKSKSKSGTESDSESQPESTATKKTSTKKKSTKSSKSSKSKSAKAAESTEEDTTAEKNNEEPS